MPTPVWGRDELRAGEMWNSNSLTSWLIVAAGSMPSPPSSSRRTGARLACGHRRRAPLDWQPNVRLASPGEGLDGLARSPAMTECHASAAAYSAGSSAESAIGGSLPGVSKSKMTSWSVRKTSWRESCVASISNGGPWLRSSFNTIPGAVDEGDDDDQPAHSVALGDEPSGEPLDDLAYGAHAVDRGYGSPLPSAPSEHGRRL